MIIPEITSKIERLCNSNRGTLLSLGQKIGWDGEKYINEAVIVQYIEAAKEFGASDDEIIVRLKDKFDLEQDEALEQLQKVESY